MLLYHVRFDLENRSRTFTPRPPAYPAVGEEREFPRVCVSTSVEGAISASPSGAERLDLAKKIQAGLFYVFRIDTEKYGLEFISSDKLLENSVYDAELTGECWVTDSFEVDESDLLFARSHSWEVEPVRVSRYTEIKFVKNLEYSVENQRQLSSLYNSLSVDKDERLAMVYRGETQIDVILDSGKHRKELESLVSAHFNSKQIEQVRRGLEDGVDVRLFADPKIHFQKMFELRKAMRMGLDVERFCTGGDEWFDLLEFVSEESMKKSKAF